MTNQSYLLTDLIGGLDQLLFKMAKAGEVSKAGRGRCVHPVRTYLIEGDPLTPHKNDKKIRNDAGEGDGDEA